MELPKGLKAIIFDLDGTLHDLAVDWDAVREALGLSEQDTVSSILESGDSSRINMITLAELDSIEGHSLRIEVRTTLTKLSQEYKLAVFTRNSREVAEKLLKDFPSMLIVGREDVTQLKPHPEGVHLILEKLKIDPDEAVLVGDTHHDVEAARAAGEVRSIVVANRTLQYQPQGADIYVESIPELLEIVQG